MLARTLLAITLFGWSILGTALPDKIHNTMLDERQAPDRLVFAHFMVGVHSSVRLATTEASLIGISDWDRQQ